MHNYLIRLDFSQTDDLWVVVEANTIEEAIKKAKLRYPTYKYLTVYSEEVNFIK